MWYNQTLKFRILRFSLKIIKSEQLFLLVFEKSVYRDQSLIISLLNLVLLSNSLSIFGLKWF